MRKRLLVDLLDIDDPKDIGGPRLEIPAKTFNFPLQSVESLTPVDEFTLLVGLDNNYPGGNGRIPGTPDGTEIITLRSRVPLRTLRVQPCKDLSTGAHNGKAQPKGDSRSQKSEGLVVDRTNDTLYVAFETIGFYKVPLEAPPPDLVTVTGARLIEPVKTFGAGPPEAFHGAGRGQCDVGSAVLLLEVGDDDLSQRRQRARSVDDHRGGRRVGGGAAGRGRKRGRNDDEASRGHGRGSLLRACDVGVSSATTPRNLPWVTLAAELWLARRMLCPTFLHAICGER